MSKNYEQCLGIYKKNINNAYKNISSALCPHSLLVVSIISDGSQELVAISLAISGSWAPDATYVQDRSQLFFFFTGGCDPTRRRTKQGRRYKYLGGKLGCLAETALPEFCKTLISLFFNFKTVFFVLKGQLCFTIFEHLRILILLYGLLIIMIFQYCARPVERRGVRAHPSYPPPYGPDIQWNLHLTKSLGTDQICLLNRGFVK